MKKQLLVVAFLISCIFGFSQSSVVIADTVIATKKSSVKENTITNNSKSEVINKQKTSTQTKEIGITVVPLRPLPKPINTETPLPTKD